MRTHSNVMVRFAVRTGKHPCRMTVSRDDTAHCDKTGHTCARVSEMAKYLSWRRLFEIAVAGTNETHKCYTV
jgi:hypothetical protein